MANSVDPDQTAPFGSSLIWGSTVCSDMSVPIFRSFMVITDIGTDPSRQALTLLHTERPKLHTILVFLSAIGLKQSDWGIHSVCHSQTLLDNMYSPYKFYVLGHTS